MSKNITLNVEKIKAKKDGLDVLSDIYIYAVLGEKISNEDLVRFQWYGIYPQENDETNSFFKIKIPLRLGELNIEQLTTLEKIIKNFSDKKIAFTNTQKVVISWLKIEDLPEILNLLYLVNLKTICSAGHTVRNVITCPINGIDPTQLSDVSSLANKLNDAFIGNKNFSNLPNKFKIAISGDEEGCQLDYTPDISFNAHKTQKDKILFSLKVLNKHIGYINPSKVVNTARIIAKLYKDFGNRKESKNSFFDSFIEHWGYEKFTEELSSKIDFKELKIDSKNKNLIKQPRIGINKSTIENESYIGCKIENEISLETFNKFILMLEKYKASKIKLTHKANIIILDAKSSTAQEFAEELKSINFDSSN